MNPFKPVRAAVLLAVCVLTLGGCISLFPESRPADLYRFEPPAAPAPTTRVAAGPANVLLSRGMFASEAAGDRLVAVHGGRVAYVAGARWVAPAEVLFNEAVVQTFEARQGRARLVRRGDPEPAQYLLRVDVDHFELRYLAGVEAAPTVVVGFSVILVRAKDRVVLGERSFETRSLTEANRVSAFIPAYDQALGETLVDLAAWVDERVITAA